MLIDRKIIILTYADYDAGFVTSQRVIDILREQGRSYAFCMVSGNNRDGERIGNAGDNEVCRDDGVSEKYSGTGVDCCLPEGVTVSELDEELHLAEMIITLGGDGTILRAARAAAGRAVPILGINLGGKGFLTELEMDEIELVRAAAAGEYKVGSRMMLDAEVRRDREVIFTDYALNDVVIKGDDKVIDLTLFGDGQRITGFSGDGAIVATPTGSTAYSMSAGGPIVEPAAHNIIVTPICAHVLEARPIVLDSDRRVSVELGDKKHNPAHVSVDGVSGMRLQSGDVINVRKSERFTRFVRLSDRSFYRKVSEKL